MGAFRRTGGPWHWGGGGVGLSDPETGVVIRRLPGLVGRPFWSPDGMSLIASGWTQVEGKTVTRTAQILADGTKLELLPFSDSEVVMDRSPDGEWLIVLALHQEKKMGGGKPMRTVRLVHPDGSGSRPLSEEDETINRDYHRFSRDGKSIIYREISKDDCSLWIVDSDGKNRRKFLAEADNRAPTNACWSPDGKILAVAYGFREGPPDRLPVVLGRKIDIVSSDGKLIRHLELPRG